MTTLANHGMSKGDVARLLALMASWDQRTIGDADVEAWHLVARHAGWNSQGAARAVVAHYAQQARRIMPADITKYLRDPGESGERICEY